MLREKKNLFEDIFPKKAREKCRTFNQLAITLCNYTHDVYMHNSKTVLFGLKSALLIANENNKFCLVFIRAKSNLVFNTFCEGELFVSLPKELLLLRKSKEDEIFQATAILVPLPPPLPTYKPPRFTPNRNRQWVYLQVEFRSKHLFRVSIVFF